MRTPGANARCSHRGEAKEKGVKPDLSFQLPRVLLREATVLPAEEGPRPRGPGAAGRFLGGRRPLVVRVQKRERPAGPSGPRVCFLLPGTPQILSQRLLSARRDTLGLTETRWLLWPQNRSYIPTRMHSVGQRGDFGRLLTLSVNAWGPARGSKRSCDAEPAHNWEELPRSPQLERPPTAMKAQLLGDLPREASPSTGASEKSPGERE
ncbi:uncharacterized protein LOC122683507 [Cervus elaphus]|uniref:uncharacterized protein LOC122683507 n=1 Tax=Cervus elaphus TaxID=9860 RepID=UPI001CC2D618|nr:uncharacterized protein LOC122683507 [Cervus elaphus]